MSRRYLSLFIVMAAAVLIMGSLFGCGPKPAPSPAPTTGAETTATPAAEDVAVFGEQAVCAYSGIPFTKSEMVEYVVDGKKYFFGAAEAIEKFKVNPASHLQVVDIGGASAFFTLVPAADFKTAMESKDLKMAPGTGNYHLNLVVLDPATGQPVTDAEVTVDAKDAAGKLTSWPLKYNPDISGYAAMLDLTDQVNYEFSIKTKRAGQEASVVINLPVGGAAAAPAEGSAVPPAAGTESPAGAPGGAQAPPAGAPGGGQAPPAPPAAAPGGGQAPPPPPPPAPGGGQAPMAPSTN